MSQPEFVSSLDRLIARLQERPGEPHPCPYLPDRQETLCGFRADSVPPQMYHDLMDRGFRRSGTFVYRPVCSGCRECIPIRVPVERFRRSRNQSRIWRRNRDIRVRAGPPQCSRGKWEMYVRYLQHQHDGAMSEAFEDFRRFLYESNVDTLEFEYRLGRRLVAVSIADVSAWSLSSVYALFDPGQKARSLGTFSSLWEIEHCRQEHIPYYYLGYYVRDCPGMSYKARFRPYELLSDDRRWSPGAQCHEARPADSDARHSSP